MESNSMRGGFHGAAAIPLNENPAVTVPLSEPLDSYFFKK